MAMKTQPFTLKVEEYVRKHPKKFTRLQLAERFKCSPSRLRGIIATRGLDDLVLPESSLRKEEPMARKTKAEVTVEARLESQLRAKTRDKQDTDKKYKAIQDDLAKTEQALADALKITARDPKVFKIKSSPPGKSGKATAFALLSDIHCDEIIPRHKVNGLNEHNPEISKRRMSRFFDLVIRSIRIERAETNIEKLVLWIGGDLFTSSESHGTPVAFDTMTAAMFAEDMIVSGIKFMREQEPNLDIHIVCSVGNHGRLDKTKNVNVPREQELSVEWAVYHHIKNLFESDEHITFQCDASYHSYVKVYDKTVRFNHGHIGWRYAEGLAGIHGPCWKKISQVWDNQVKADLTCFGHYHIWTPAALGRPYMCNGSVVGISPYGANFGFEPPAQMFFFIHSKHGILGQRPLLLDT